MAPVREMPGPALGHFWSVSRKLEHHFLPAAGGEGICARPCCAEDQPRPVQSVAGLSRQGAASKL